MAGSNGQVQQGGLEIFFYLAWKAVREELTRSDCDFLSDHRGYAPCLVQAATLIEALPVKSTGIAITEQPPEPEEDELRSFFMLAYAALRPSELNEGQRQFLHKYRQLSERLREAAKLIEGISKFAGTREPLAQAPGGGVLAVGVAASGPEVPNIGGDLGDGE